MLIELYVCVCLCRTFIQRNKTFIHKRQAIQSFMPHLQLTLFSFQVKRNMYNKKTVICTSKSSKESTFLTKTVTLHPNPNKYFYFLPISVQVKQFISNCTHQWWSVRNILYIRSNSGFRFGHTVTLYLVIYYIYMYIILSSQTWICIMHIPTCPSLCYE